MSRPLIGITLDSEEPGGWSKYPWYAIRQNYASMLENIDRQIGRFLEVVAERGELERTLVVYSSDHGEMLGDHSRWGKSTYYQASAGVPLVVAGPGVQRGVTSGALVSMHDLAATFLTSAREAAADRLTAAVMGELSPLKLERARFRVALEPIEGRRGPDGVETVRFQIATNAGTDFGPLDAIASGGELARFALAMKAALASREDMRQPVMIFDEVDQGVGGAVAEAVGQRLKRLSTGAQVLVVTHSPQVAARGHAHWKVRKADAAGMTTTTVDTLTPDARQEEIARMLSGATVTEEARAAARSLIG